MGKSSSVSLNAPLSLMILVVILALLGLLFVFEASVAEAFTTFGDQYHFLKQHAAWLGLGLAGMTIASFIPLQLWEKLSRPLFVMSLIFLVMVFLPGIGRELNGAHRWIFLGSVRFQPIEVVKFSLIVYFASWLSKHQRLGPFLFTIGLPSVLLLLQPDLGSLLVLVSVAVAMYFVAGGKLAHLLAISSIGVGLVSLAVLTSSYRWERLQTFLNPASDPLDSGFHMRQITLALGRGGLFGQGIGNSRQKFSYIPEASTDSIFAIITEEVGLVGSLVFLILFGLMFTMMVKTIGRAPSRSFAQLLGWGIFSWIAVQALLNLSAVVSLVPLTGIPLPFISYGGTSLVMILFATGVLLRIGKEYN